jgi:hypothetical protein
MSFGGINGAGPQGAPVFGNQGAAAAGAVPGQAGAPANGATPFFGTSIESIMAAVSRGEIPLNLAVQVNQLGGVASSPNSNISLLQAIQQGQPQNGTNGLGVRSGPSPATEGTAAVGIGSNNSAAGANTDNSSTVPVDSRQMSVSAAIAPLNQYVGN